MSEAELGTMDELIEELSLGSARGGRRRAEAPVSISVIRQLEAEDIPRLSEPVGSVPSIPEIKHQHHQIANYIARGMKNAEISAVTGFSPSFISILRNAPDMKELVEYYASQAEERGIDALARLRTMGLSSVEELQTRLNNEPEKFTIGQLAELTELGLIRPLAAIAGAKGAMGVGKPQAQINIVFKSPEPSSGSGVLIEATAVGEAAE